MNTEIIKRTFSRDKRIAFKVDVALTDWITDKYKSSKQVVEDLQYKIEERFVEVLAAQLVDKVEPAAKELLAQELLDSAKLRLVLDKHYQARVKKWLDKDDTL